MEIKRGRRPVTRARVMTYWNEHGPCSLGQVMRACQLHDRAQALRILRKENCWPAAQT